jgi:hypothetical protein
MKVLRETLIYVGFVMLFGFAIMANVSDGSLGNYRAAWITHTMR